MRSGGKGGRPRAGWFCVSFAWREAPPPSGSWPRRRRPSLHLKINRVFRKGGRESLVHRFEGPEGEVLTRLGVERYGDAERPGYALAVQRGEEKINVPTSAERFLFAADFLRHLARQQSWVEAASP